MLKNVDTIWALTKFRRKEHHLAARGMGVSFMKAEKGMSLWQGHKLGNFPRHLCFILYKQTSIALVAFAKKSSGLYFKFIHVQS